MKQVKNHTNNANAIMNEKKTSSITPSGPECLDEQCNIISTKWSPWVFGWAMQYHLATRLLLDSHFMAIIPLEFT